jgi:Ser/Thr protein kinase RdoA (MazF antagonist)
VKIGATESTAGWTRLEHRNYRAITGSFLPDVLGYDDDGDRPVLALEDLSGADWPPPWTADRVAAVLDGLASVHGTRPPTHLMRRTFDPQADWRTVAANPGSFLALGLCSTVWLESALPTLTEAAGEAPLAGNALVHLDVRSDNLCFRDGRAVLVDWNHASIANPELDVAFWLPSLHAEGGPPPEAILPDAPALAAYVAGFFCARAAGDPLPEAPHVRPLQLQQARIALAWAARALDMPPPNISVSPR